MKNRHVAEAKQQVYKWLTRYGSTVYLIGPTALISRFTGMFSTSDLLSDAIVLC